MKISELSEKIETIAPGPRFGHFLIDFFAIELISYIINLIPLFEISGFLQLLLFPAYYILFEFYYQWTPGKFITGTVVIDDFGDKPDIQTIILRSFIRLVPFEPFSCLDEKSFGWHDKWSKTYVVKKEEVLKIKEKLGSVSSEKSLASSPSMTKTKKNILIISIIGVVTLSAYIITRQINHVINFNMEETVSDLNKADYKTIAGEWHSDWKIYKVLNFKNGNMVTATNQSGDKLELTYSINMRNLTLKDNNGLKLDYIIIEFTDDKMIWRDLKTMKDNIEFKKK